jgi:DNA-binding MarR family transcriptional regulator
MKPQPEPIPLQMLSRHGQVLALIAAKPGITVEAIGAEIGISSRQVGRMITDLERAEVLRRVRSLNRNGYELISDTKVALGEEILPLESLLNRLR